MTHKIKYNCDEVPPFPYINLEISHIINKNYKLETGKIDTGASRTIIPKYLIESLNLKSVGKVPAVGFNGKEQICNIYYVSVKINDLTYDYVKVIASPVDRKNLLIGRDLINLWQMNIDGRNYTGEFTPVSCYVEI